MTWYAIIVRHSGIDGLTLPGMIEEPGCTAGRAISPRAVVGPEARSRRSLHIRISSTESSFREDMKAPSCALVSRDSNEFGEAWKGIFVSLTMVSKNFWRNSGCAFAP